MNYRETENWILNRLPFYQSQGLKAYKPGIDNIRFFVEQLNLNLLEIKFIHVGGTNGKGSTCAYLSSIIQESGYKVGLFTSPHFFDFRERIKVNNKKIEKDFIIKFIQENIELIEELNLSFFELSFGMSLYYFFEQKVDYAVIEVGLGGRLDATNIINPLLSVITNISYDHTEILGNTLEKIAYEKAGIIKKNTKIIIGERDKKTQNIFIQKAEENFSDVIFASDYKTDFENSEIEYQNKNIRTAVQVSKNLINYNPKVIFDSAHNESGFSYLSQQLKKLNYDRLFIILSFVKGKDVKKLITLLPKKSLIYFTSSNTERSMNYEEITQCVKENINFDKNPMKVYKEVLKQSSSKDLIIITGSNYIAKEIFHE